MATQTIDVSVTPPDVTTRQDHAEAIVKRNVYWAVGAGAIPVPLLDFAAITGVQIKMLKQLSNEYGIPFLEHKVKNVVGSLLAASLSVGTGTALIFSMLKFIPVIGTAAGFVSVSIAAGSITYATGRVFIQHFESGGTFLDFDPKKVRERYRAEMERGKEVAAAAKAQASAPAPAPTSTKPS